MQVCKFYKPRMSYLLRFELLFARHARSEPILTRRGRLSQVETECTRLASGDARPMPIPPVTPQAHWREACRPPKSLLLS